MLKRECISILGIPVDNLTITETIDSIFRMVDDYQNNSTPKYIATVNVDFITNTISWSSKGSRHPELLDVLRRADLVTADGMPVVWIPRLMSSPIKERVAGSDLLPLISEKAAGLNKSIFLFGARPGIADNAAKILNERYSGLRIAGTYSPVVATEGEEMLDSFEEDQKLVTMINNSGADILFIGLGNPKQEIWFNRNRDNIEVPVSIGVGGSFSFITGDVLRAPVWMQKSGLEWMYRIYKDPRRLWKRYLKGLVKLGVCILLPMLYHIINKTLIMLKGLWPNTIDKSDVNISQNDMAVTYEMPLKATRESISDIRAFIMKSKEPLLVLDFKNTKYIDLYLMGFLISLWRYFKTINKKIYLTGVSSHVKRMLKYNRLQDIADELTQGNHEIITEPAVKSAGNSFSCITSSDNNFFRIELSGRLDAASIAELDVRNIIESIGSKNCIINLKDLKFVDSTGLTFFIRIKKLHSTHNKTPFLCNANQDIMQMFNITKLNNLFKIVPDFNNNSFLLKDSI
jgi:N-acetylglucosaminyldiphosphoundecaprenol N-acetyl-beta-D-mannosaminyltransferase